MSDEPGIVILAGGEGKRLAPDTSDLPKPLLPRDGISTLEVLLHSLREQGFRRATLAVAHLADRIQDFVGDGSHFGLELHYSVEESPLSTAGPLRLIENPPTTLIAINADVLTTLKYADLLAAHRRSSAAATVSVVPYRVDLNYGVVETDGARVQRVVEKPHRDFLISLGVNVVEARTLEAIRPGEALDMPSFVNRLVDRGEPVAFFRSECPWLDIGRPDDLDRAQSFIDRHFGHFETPTSRPADDDSEPDDDGAARRRADEPAETEPTRTRP